jgi:hypothetical protein
MGQLHPFFGLFGGVSKVSVKAYSMKMLDHSIPDIFMDEAILRLLSPTSHSWPYPHRGTCGKERVSTGKGGGARG